MTPADALAAHTRGRPRDPEVDRAILDAVLDLLGDGGYESLTVEAVAARAGVARASIYRRYSGRIELLEAAFRHFAPPTQNPPDTGSIRGDLVAIVRGLAATMERSGSGRLLPSMVAASGKHPEVREALNRFSASKRAPSVEVIRRAIGRGELRAETDAELVADLLVGSVMYRILLRGGRVGTRHAEHLVDTVLEGAAAR